MVLKRAQSAIARRRRGLSLRAILVVPFVLQLCLAVGVTNWLSWRNGQQAIENLAFSLQSETGERVQLKLANHLETPVLISRLNGEAWRNGQIDLETLSNSEDYLLRQLIQFEGVSNILVANAAGEMRAVSREGSARLLGSAPEQAPQKSAEYQFELGSQSQQALTEQPLGQRFKQDDIRQTSWYRNAVMAQDLVWGADTNTFVTRGKSASQSLQASLPLYDQAGKLAGLVSSGISSANLEQFLSALVLRDQGRVFILGPDNQLIASSPALDSIPSETADQSSLSLPPSSEIRNVETSAPLAIPPLEPFIAGVIAALPQSSSDSTTSQQFNFQPNPTQSSQGAFSPWLRRDRYFVTVIPLANQQGNGSALSRLAPPAGQGLNWRIVIATPEQAFTRQLSRNTRTTLGLSTVALLGAIALGLATANWLARPIMRLSRASQAIARGDLEHPLLADSTLTQPAPIQEVATLANSFRQMTQRLRRSFDNLEIQVHGRTRQLQQSFEFEATLKRLTDRVRDSLDENKILHRAVQELALALGVKGCTAAIYDLERQTSTVRYEYTVFPKRLQGSILDMNNFAGYSQLLAGQHFQHCGIIAVPSRGHVTMLACPILDDQGVLGDLWLIKPAQEAFTNQEIRLVQQVANQCAIAIRQARLYQTAQRQVTELERLNQLKDDFLSTVSHELRTPMANMKMALQMLEISRQRKAQAQSADPATSQNNAPDPSQRYFGILKEAVQRESTLIENLLDLSRIDIQSALPQLSTIEPRRWLRQIVQPYCEKTSDRLRWQLFLPDYLPLLQTDAEYLQRILMELLDNACKYSPDGECITVSVQLEQGWLSFSVGNSGIEISPQEQQRIFERFYRIPTSDPWKHGGTGLGLALVRQLSERLGGQVQVESSNHHTLFTVSFPLTLENE